MNGHSYLHHPHGAVDRRGLVIKNSNSLDSRGSTRLGGSGLLVLALGAMVLLSALSSPRPASHNLVEATVRMAPAGRSMPNWAGGMAMIGVALVVMGARRRAQAPVDYATAEE